MSRFSKPLYGLQHPGNQQDVDITDSLGLTSRSPGHPLCEQDPEYFYFPQCNPSTFCPKLPKPISRSKSTQLPLGLVTMLDHGRDTDMHYPLTSSSPNVRTPDHATCVGAAPPRQPLPKPRTGRYPPSSCSVPITRAASAGATLSIFHHRQPRVHSGQSSVAARNESGSHDPFTDNTTVQPEPSGFDHPHLGSDAVNVAARLSSISMCIQHPSPSDEGFRRSRSPPLETSPTPSDQGSSSPGGAFDSSAAREDNSDLSPSRPSKKKTSKTSKRHSCPICSKDFPRPSGLKTHLNTHSMEKPYKCPDPDCDKTFSVRSNARRHYRGHGGDPNELDPRRLSVDAMRDVVFSEQNREVLSHHDPAASTLIWRGPLRWTKPRTGPRAPSYNQAQPVVPGSPVCDPSTSVGPGFVTGSASQVNSSTRWF